jgi:hypothetical protein
MTLLPNLIREYVNYSMLISWILVLVGFSANALGDENSAIDNSSIIKINTFLNDSRKNFSNYIDNLSYNVDSYMSSESVEGTRYYNKAKLSFFTRNKLGQSIDYGVRLKIKLDLPHTKKRLKLFLSSENDTPNSNDENFNQIVKNTSYSAVLRFIFSEKEKWTVDLDSGARLRFHPELFSRFRIQRHISNKFFIADFIQELFWFNTEGFGSSINFQLLHELSATKVVRWGVSIKHLVDDGYNTYATSLVLYHQLNNRDSLSYIFSGYGDNDEYSASLYDYRLGVSYRRDVHEGWVFVAINPELQSAREDSYDIKPILTLRLEMHTN